MDIGNFLKMSTEEEGPDPREQYITKFSRLANPGEAKCCKCDRLAFVYPGDSVPMDLCIVCIRTKTEEKIQKMELERNGGIFGPVWSFH